MNESVTGKKPRHGFTLIELLVVVAIIAVLAAIALPNFLEAQTRARVSRIVSDMRAVGIAMEAYIADQNNIPLPNPWRYDYSQSHFVAEWLMLIGPPELSHSVPGGYPGPLLTTPVAYITAIPLDPFNTAMLLKDDSYWGPDRQIRGASMIYTGWPLNQPTDVRDNFLKLLPNYVPQTHWFFLESAGPDLLWWQTTGQNAMSFFYDPTNGTTSAGQIVYVQGGFTYPRR